MSQLFFLTFSKAMRIAGSLTASIDRMCHQSSPAAISRSEAESACETSLLDELDRAASNWFTADDARVNQNSASSSSSSLFVAVVQAVRRPLLCGALLRLLSDASMVSAALVLRQLLRWMISSSFIVVSAAASGTASSTISAAESVTEGALWAAALCAFAIIYSFSFEQSLWYSRVATLKMYQLLVNAMMQSVSSTHQATLSSKLGYLQQLHGVQCLHVPDFSSTVQALWITPVNIAVIMYVLYVMLDWPGLLAVPVMIFVIFIQATLSSVIGAVQAKLTVLTNARLQRLTQLIQAIRIVKFMSWEDAVEKTISDLRTEELLHLKTFTIVRSILFSTMFTAPILSSLTVYGVSHATGTRFNPEDVLSGLLLMVSLRMGLFSFPMGLMHLRHTMVAAAGIESLGTKGDASAHLQPYRSPLTNEDIADGNAVVVTDATILPTTHGGASALMRSISFRVPRTKLTAICGPTGSGKSLLLHLIAGECLVELQQGKNDAAHTHHAPVRISDVSKVSVASQEAWIFTATVRENIVCGFPMDNEWYQEVLAHCQLCPDLAQFENGDLTVVGERGVTVSGGQRQRIAVARAAYATHFGAEIVLLDDPFAAVDVAVGRSLFFDCLCNSCADTTRVVATHKLELLPFFDHIILLDANQTVVFEGSYESYAVQFNVAAASPTKGLQSSSSLMVEQIANPNASQDFTALSPMKHTGASSSALDDLRPGSFVTVDRGTLKWYAKQFGIVPLCGTGLAFCAARTLQLLSELSLVWWTTHDKLFANGQPSMAQYFASFASFSAAAVVVGTLMVLPITSGVMRSAKKMHAEMVRRILSAPLRVFDVIPTGQLVSQFSKALQDADFTVPENLVVGLMQLLTVVGLICLIGYSSPWILFVYLGLIVAVWVLIVFWLPVNRSLLQLEDRHRSRSTEVFVELVGGIDVARSSGRLEYFERLHRERVRRFVTCRAGSRLCYQWVAARVSLIASIAICITIFVLFGVFASKDAMLHLQFVSLSADGSTIIATYASSRFDGLSGMMIALAVVPSLGIFANLMVIYLSDMDVQISRLESIRQFIEKMPQEDCTAAAAEEGGACEQQPPTSPKGKLRGELTFRNVCVRYAPSLPLTLQNVSFTIPAGAKVGVVGRTGSGKSTLSLALLRLVDVCGDGAIELDGLNTATAFASRRDLRRHFSMIPQDPILFAGTVRFNLDPYGSCSDEKLWQVLQKVGLEARLRSDQLRTVVEERGGNFSQGERQLLCLARAMLKPDCCVVILDEATASVDQQNDSLIQRVVREEFTSHTVVCIAHRIRSVIHSDLVVVLNQGSVEELGNPRALLACLREPAPSQSAPSSAFARMIEGLGEEEVRSIVEELA